MNFETRLLLSILGNGGKSDIRRIEEIVDDLEKETDYDLEDVVREAKAAFGEKIDVNSLLYAALELYANAMKEKLSSFFEEEDIKNFIWNLKPNIYTNFMDSGFDSEFRNWSVSDITSKENALDFIAEYIRSASMYDHDHDEVPQKLHEMIEAMERDREKEEEGGEERKRIRAVPRSALN